MEQMVHRWEVEWSPRAPREKQSSSVHPLIRAEKADNPTVDMNVEKRDHCHRWWADKSPRHRNHSRSLTKRASNTPGEFDTLLCSSYKL